VARAGPRQEGIEEEEGKAVVMVRNTTTVRDTTTTTLKLKFRITTPNYLPMESTTHTPKIILYSTQCVVIHITYQPLT
jgi:hypothetical protein